MHLPHRRPAGRLLLAGLLAIGGAVGGAVGGSAAAAHPAYAGATKPVQVFPSPGSRTVSPASQISFRGVSTLGQVGVVGSVTGSHQIRLVRHSDQAGVSVVPTIPFAPGETVTVRTALAVAGSTSGTFTYQVARPAPVPAGAPSIYPTPRFTAAAATPTSVGPYHSRPDLKPPPIATTASATPAPGLLFASSGVQTSSADTGVMIYDNAGQPVWFNPLPATTLGTLQRIRYQGQDALTWFTGTQAFRGGFKGT